MSDVSKVGSWVPEENLKVLLREIALLSGEELHPDLELYLVDKITQTDGDASPDIWFTHEFEGSESILGQFAIDQGAGILQAKLSANSKIKPNLEVILYLIQKYTLL